MVQLLRSSKTQIGLRHGARRVILAAAVSAGVVLSAGAAQAEVRPPVACEALSGAHIAGLEITRAHLVAAGPLKTTLGGGPNGDLPSEIAAPEHCLIEGSMESYVGAEGKRYAIGVEIRAPLNWNGRLLFQGGGGFDGVIPTAYGENSSNVSTATPGLARGFTVVTTDSGHKGGIGLELLDGRFGGDQEARINFAYAAIGKVTLAARGVVDTMFGRPPERTYFVGCSNGGREALIAAERYPLLFDGVAAGDPGFSFWRAGLHSAFAHRTLTAAHVTVEDMKTLAAGVLRQCDGLDGQVDGLVFDHAACRFDPKSLVCKPGQTACLSDAKADAISVAFRGPLDHSGRALFAPFPYDGGVAAPSFTDWMLGHGTPGIPDGILAKLIDDFVDYLRPGTTKQIDAGGFDYEAALAAANGQAGILDATSTDFSTFRGHGGRIILTTGWGDGVFSANELIDWYRAARADARLAPGAGDPDFMRLFIAPGMQHCGGGPAMSDFDTLTALVDWVEKGRAPDLLVATGPDFSGQSRPLCAYPAQAAYAGAGPGRNAKDYACRIPRGD